MAKRYWLLKTEPSTYSIDDLKRDKTTYWEGVRNYRARNILRDEIKLGDAVLFYHSNADPPAVVGTATVTKAGYPDPMQFDKKSRYYDAKSSPEKPRWFVVDIRYASNFKRPVSLPELRETRGIEDMVLLNVSRLSVQPVTAKEWKVICKLGEG